MSSKAQALGASGAFSRAGQARSVRRQVIEGTLGGSTPTQLPLHLISHNPDNPREKIGDVSALADTLIEVGLVNAITVASVEAYLRDRPGRAADLAPGAEYVVIDGHRRHAAAQQSGLGEIKVTVNNALAASDEGLLEAAFVANIQRENMSDLEEAQALEKLVKFYGSQGKAAKRLGITQAFISQRLSLLALAPDLQADLDAGIRKVEHVRGLAKLPPEEQRAKADSRAEEAQRKAEEKKRFREAQQRPATAAPQGPADAPHNDVMSPGAPPTERQPRPPHNVVMGHASAAAANGPRPVATVPPARTQDPKEPAEVQVDAMPWDNPLGCLQIASVRMTPEHFDQMLRHAQEMLQGGSGRKRR